MITRKKALPDTDIPISIIDYRLYLVTNSAVISDMPLITAVEQAILGGVTLVQLREKNLDSRAFFEQAISVKQVCDKHGIPLLINDRVDIALAVGADGVHIGQADLPAEVVRRLIGDDKILGVTAKTVKQAIYAEQAGANYLGVGAVFGTTTKADAQPISHDTLKEICQAMTIPVVAIGGITADNILQLQGTGMAGVAVVSGILGQPDIKTASKNLREKLAILV